MLEEERYWLGKITNYITIIFFLLNFYSCSPISSIASLAANAGVSSKGFSASVDDSFLKAKIITKISSLKASYLTDVTVSVTLGEVLLTGYSDDQLSRLKLIEEVSKIEGVKKVYNEIIIKPSVSAGERAEDALFESRLVTRMLFKSGINSNNFSLDVVSGNVYIIGLADDLDEKMSVENFFSEMKDIPKLITIIKIKNKGEQN